MKRYTIASLYLLTLITYASKPVEPEKPVYQMDWGVMPPGDMWFGGAWSERTIKVDKEQIENNQYAQDLERGSNLIYIGIWVAVISIVLHFSTSSSHIVAGKFARVFEWGIVGGGFLVIAGSWFKKAMELQGSIALGGIILAGLILSQKNVRGWSVSHLFSKLKKQTEPPALQTQDNGYSYTQECSSCTCKADPSTDTHQTK